MNQTKNPHIFVVGNEKGGAGKTTCSMHLIIGLLDKGYDIASIDVDSRQHSLTSYLNNRKIYNEKNPETSVMMPMHFHIKQSIDQSNAELEEQASFEQSLPTLTVPRCALLNVIGY